MTVSKIASKIYQAAKKSAKGVWIWTTEWSAAMKKAWRKVMAKAVKTVEEIAADIAADLGGRTWEGYGKVRVYVYKNWIGISAEGIDLSGLGRNHNEEMKAAAYKAAAANGLEVYEIYRGRKIAA